MRGSHVRWETPRGRYDAVQQQVFPQKETKVIEPVGAATLQKVVNGARKIVLLMEVWTVDVESAHNTIKLLCPNEIVRLSISLAC